ncbi:unnamed protein product [Effrenium voratum]|nr:unnamed protein product [Effrenium voratum]
MDDLPVERELVLFLCDSLLCAHKSSGVKLHQLKDDGQTFLSCLCIASGGALVLGGESCHSAVALALQALQSPQVHDHLAEDPAVRVLVLRAARSTAKCRTREQFPQIVRDRAQSQLIQDLETPWSVCDLEDVIQGREARFAELSPCQLRHGSGIYGKGDDLHFRKDIAVAAGDELLKAVRRTAATRYPDYRQRREVLLVLAAGWNAEGLEDVCLDEDGHAWRRAELVALAELCALNGHGFFSFHAKFVDLLRRCREEHIPFLFQEVSQIRSLLVGSPEIKPLPLTRPAQQGLPFKRRKTEDASQTAPSGATSHQAIDLEAAEPLAEPLAELLNMGFPLAAAQRALQRCSGLWEAVDQLLQGG